MEMTADGASGIPRTLGICTRPSARLAPVEKPSTAMRLRPPGLCAARAIGSDSSTTTAWNSASRSYSAAGYGDHGALEKLRLMTSTFCRSANSRFHSSSSRLTPTLQPPPWIVNRGGSVLEDVLGSYEEG